MKPHFTFKDSRTCQANIQRKENSLARLQSYIEICKRHDRVKAAAVEAGVTKDAFCAVFQRAGVKPTDYLQPSGEVQR